MKKKYKRIPYADLKDGLGLHEDGIEYWAPRMMLITATLNFIQEYGKVPNFKTDAQVRDALYLMVDEGKYDEEYEAIREMCDDTAAAMKLLGVGNYPRGKNHKI